MVMENRKDDFMSQIVDEDAWKELSSCFLWNEQLLDKYQDKVDWKKISQNENILWTKTMLEKFCEQIDWHELSQTEHQCALQPDNLERFKQYWDWHELSCNSSLEFTYELLDRFADYWDWSKIIDISSYRCTICSLYGMDFLHRYQERIPASQLRDTALWDELVEQRKMQIAKEIAR